MDPDQGQPQPQILVGPAGWSYEDWKGRVYPRTPPRDFDALRWIARFFDLVEVNASFYAVPSARMTGRWPDQVPREFRFAVKLFREFTHAAALPPRSVDAAFLDALAPLRDAGCLGPLLIQFPWSFRYGKPAVERLRALADRFAVRREQPAVGVGAHAHAGRLPGRQAGLGAAASG